MNLASAQTRGRSPHLRQFLLERDTDWLTVWFNRPGARNALSHDVSTELNAIVAAVREDRSIRGVTLRGKGKVFCAGGDIKGFQNVFQGGELNLDDVAASNAGTGELFNAINTLPQVVVEPLVRDLHLREVFKAQPVVVELLRDVEESLLRAAHVLLRGALRLVPGALLEEGRGLATARGLDGRPVRPRRASRVLRR